MAQEIFLNKLLAPMCKKLLNIQSEKKKIVAEIGKEFRNPSDLARCYVEPNCQHGNPADTDEISSPIYRPLFETLNDIIRSDSSKRDGRNHVFLLADAGMGKTSALLMLKMSHVLSFWRKPYDCQLLKLGEGAFARINAIEDPANTVLLLDALDEDKFAWERTADYISLLIRDTINFKKVIISCRTQFFPQGPKDPHNRAGMIVIRSFTCQVLYLSLFNDNQVQKYLEKKFTRVTPYGERQINHSYIQRANNILSCIHSLKLRPLLLNYIDDLVDSGLTNERLYDIYSTLVNEWLRRECQKMEHLESRKLELACMYAAFEMVTGRDPLTLSELDIDKIKVKYPEISLLHRLEIGGRSLLNRNSEGRFRFSHFTIQEFLLAKGVDEQVYTPEEIILIPITNMVLEFLQSIAYTFENYYLDKTNMPGANITAISDIPVRMIDVSFVCGSVVDCIIDELHISNSNLYCATINNTQVNSATITQSYFNNAKFIDNKITNTYFTDNKMKNIQIFGGSISDSHFYRIDFRHANFSCELTRCIFEESDFFMAKFNGADITGTHFKNCLNLNEGDIIRSKNWQKAIFDEEFMRKLNKLDKEIKSA